MRRRQKNKRQVRVIVGISICLLLIMTVGYAAFSTNLTLTAKGNIHNLVTSEKLKNKVVTSGDGLYIDTYEENRYIFKGSNPDNHIKFNNQDFRIVAIENDNTLKIVKEEGVGISFDAGYDLAYNNGEFSSPANSVQNTRYTTDSADYCYHATETAYVGCGIWAGKDSLYSKDGAKLLQIPKKGAGKYNLPSSDAYINAYLNATQYVGKNLSNTYYGTIGDDKVYIQEHWFNVGSVNKVDINVFEIIENEKEYKWKGNIGLLNISDYLKAHSMDNCDVLTSTASEDCKNSNYLYKSSLYFWLISSCGGPNGSWLVNPNGGFNCWSSRDGYKILPVIYLKADVKLLGSGTSSDPYTIK